MTEYLIKSTLALSVAYLIYIVFAKRVTNFKWLRFYFLTAILTSLIFPCLKYLPIQEQKPILAIPADHLPVFMVDEFNSSEDTSIIPSISPATEDNITFSEILRFIYVAGSLFFLLRFILGLLQLVRMIVKHGFRKRKGYYLVEVPDQPSPFSFFGIVFIQPGMEEPGKGTMLQHERIHIRQLHSIDLLLLEFLCILQWFNPFAWLIRNKVKEIHEFLADEAMIKEFISPVDYQLLLLRQVLGKKLLSPVNGFKISITKKRILMITNNKRNKRWFGIAILLIVSILITDALTRVNVAQKTTTPEETKKMSVERDTDKSDVPPPPPRIKSSGNKIPPTPPYVETSEPKFPGTLTQKTSSNAIERYIYKNLRYPENYRQLKPGFVSVKFTVTEDGKIENVQAVHSDKSPVFMMMRVKFDAKRAVYVSEDNAQYVETTEPALIKEAIRVVSSMPEFEPARDKDGKRIKKETGTSVFFDKSVRENIVTIKNNLNKQLFYPEQAKNAKSQGIVFAKFDIDKNGSIGDFSFVSDKDIPDYERKPMQPTFDPVLQQEVQKIFRNMPQFNEKLNPSDVVAHLRFGILFHLIQ